MEVAPMNEEVRLDSLSATMLQRQKERMMNEPVKNEVVNVHKASMPSINIDAELLKMGNLGAENVKAKDVLIPRLTILQALSPQLAKKKAEYIEGAEIGDFCNVATGDIYKEAINVIPCHFATAYIEWGKNRGGLVANHGDDASILAKAVRNEQNQNILPNGNLLSETSQWYCLLQDGASWSRIFIPLTSTNLKHSRKWMTLCRTESVQMPDGTLWKPPLFWRSWKLIAIEDSNDRGDWTTFKPEKGDSVLELDPSRQLIRMCMSFYEDVKSNVVRGEINEEDRGGGPIIDGKANTTTSDEVPF
jgi:hypothetical protein